MKDAKGNRKRSDDQPSDRQISQAVSRKAADEARATRKSGIPGVDDDNSVVQSAVAALAAPVEGALDSLRERERFASQGRELGPDQVGGVSGQRAEDIPQFGEDAKRRIPTRPEDAEADPKEIAEDHTPGGRR